MGLTTPWDNPLPLLTTLVSGFVFYPHEQTFKAEQTVEVARAAVERSLEITGFSHKDSGTRGREGHFHQKQLSYWSV